MSSNKFDVPERGVATVDFKKAPSPEELSAARKLSRQLREIDKDLDAILRQVEGRMRESGLERTAIVGIGMMSGQQPNEGKELMLAWWMPGPKGGTMPPASPDQWGLFIVEEVPAGFAAISFARPLLSEPREVKLAAAMHLGSLLRFLVEGVRGQHSQAQSAIDALKLVVQDFDAPVAAKE